MDGEDEGLGEISPYEVVAVGGTAVNVRSTPNASSQSIAKKLKGNVVYGIQQGDWVKLTREPGFILMKLPDGRELLRVKLVTAADPPPPDEAEAPPVPPEALAARPGCWGTLGLDQDVVELCDNYHIDDVHARRLNMLLLQRKETMGEDLVRLWTDMETARNPNALLAARMREMEDGLFVGNVEAEPEMEHLKMKFQLDKEAGRKLCEYVMRHPPEKRQMYYTELEVHLEAAKKPSATAMTLLKTIRAGEPLGAVTHTFKGYTPPPKVEPVVEEKPKPKEKPRDEREDERERQRQRYHSPKASRDRGRDDRGDGRGDDRGDGRGDDRGDGRGRSREDGARGSQFKDFYEKEPDRHRSHGHSDGGRERHGYSDGGDRERRDRDYDQRPRNRERPAGGGAGGAEWDEWRR